MVSHLVWQCHFSSFTLCTALSYVCSVVLLVYDTWRNVEHRAVRSVLYRKLPTNQTFPVTVHISLGFCFPEFMQDPLRCLRAAFVWNITNTVTYFMVTATLEQPNIAKFFLMLHCSCLKWWLLAESFLQIMNWLQQTRTKRREKSADFLLFEIDVLVAMCSQSEGLITEGLFLQIQSNKALQLLLPSLHEPKLFIFNPWQKYTGTPKYFRDNQLN